MLPAETTTTIPAATDCLTRELVQSLQTSGLDQMAVSIDFPRAELHVFERSGHMTFVEQNDEYMKVVREFLDGTGTG